MPGGSAILGKNTQVNLERDISASHAQWPDVLSRTMTRTAAAKAKVMKQALQLHFVSLALKMAWAILISSRELLSSARLQWKRSCANNRSKLTFWHSTQLNFKEHLQE